MLTGVAAGGKTITGEMKRLNFASKTGKTNPFKRIFRGYNLKLIALMGGWYMADMRNIGLCSSCCNINTALVKHILPVQEPGLAQTQ